MPSLINRELVGSFPTIITVLAMVVFALMAYFVLWTHIAAEPAATSEKKD